MTPQILDDLLAHTSALRGLACALVGEAHADDVLQEAALESLRKPPRREGATTGWLVAVVRNLANKTRRRESTRRRYESAISNTHQEAADRGAEDADNMRALTDAVTSLPEPYRTAILMRYLREQTPTEIAAETNTPVSTVKTRLQRGLVMLRERLEHNNNDWRVAFAATFATQPSTKANASTPMLSSSKLLITLTILLPLALFAWMRNGPATAKTEQAAELHDDPGQPESATANVLSPGEAERAPTSKASSAADDPSSSAIAKRPPLKPVMRLHVAGPAAFRRAFAPTNLSAMLSSPDGEKLWRPLLAPIEALWQQWDGRGDEFRAARNRALDYAGRIRVLWLLEPDTSDRHRMFGVLSLELDEQTDMAALAVDLSQPLRSLQQAEPAQHTVANHKVQLAIDESEIFLSMPMLIDRRVVAFFGEAGTLELAVTHGLQTLAADIAPRAAPASLDVDLAQLVHASGEEHDPVLRPLFGLGSLKSLQLQLRPNGNRVEVSADVAWHEGPRGIFAGLLPDVQQLPNMLSRMPATATPWLTAPLRPDLILRAVLDAAANSEPDGREGVREAMHKELGLHLDTELLAHLGGEVMLLGDMWQPEDRKAFQEGEDLPLAGCVAFSLRDTAAFAAGLDKVLNYLGAHIRQSKARVVDGVKITKLGSMFVTGVHMAVGQDLFAIAIGEESVAQLEALVAGKSQPTQAPLPASVLRIRHLAPKGWNAVGATNLGAMLGGQAAMVMQLLDNPMARALGFELEPEQTQDMLEALLPLIEHHALTDLVTMAGYRDGRWQLRILW
tara:strand:- start:34009 stop:36381 length:2373 start_codon:yes stop_codon:yes gene_type:complete